MEEKKIQDTNYPQVFGKYLFSLNISMDNRVQLIIDTLSYGKSFSIYPGQHALINELTISFKAAEDIMGFIDPEGIEESLSYMEYEIVLSNNANIKKSITFDSLDKNELLLKWNIYNINILELNYDYLKMDIKKL